MKVKGKTLTYDEVLNLKEGTAIRYSNKFDFKKGKGFDEILIVKNNFELTNNNYSKHIDTNLKQDMNNGIVIIYEWIESEEKEYKIEQNDLNLTGRRFKILFKNHQFFPKYIEGVVENFNFSSNIMLIDENYGFNIIPFESISYMLEVK